MPPAPECPRCGYDLSGPVGSWQDSCPLTSICPECGLEFHWRDLLSLAYASHLHLFEHARFRRTRAWWRTIRKPLRPRRFWQWIRFDQPIRMARLVFASLTGAGVMYTIGAAITASMFALVMTIDGLFRGHSLALAFDGLEVFSASVFCPVYASVTDGVPLALALTPPTMLALMPVAFLLLTRTFRREGIRRAHIARAALYSLIGFALVWHIPIWLGTALSLYLFIVVDELGLTAWDLNLTAGRAQAFAYSTVIGIPSLWILWFWYRAARDYFYLSRPGPTTVVLSVLALVASWLIMAVITTLVPVIANLMTPH